MPSLGVVDQGGARHHDVVLVDDAGPDLLRAFVEERVEAAEEEPWIGEATLEVFSGTSGENCEAVQAKSPEPQPGTGDEAVEVAGLEVVRAGQAANVGVGGLAEYRPDADK